MPKPDTLEKEIAECMARVLRLRLAAELAAREPVKRAIAAEADDDFAAADAWRELNHRLDGAEFTWSAESRAFVLSIGGDRIDLGADQPRPQRQIGFLPPEPWRP